MSELLSVEVDTNALFDAIDALGVSVDAHVLAAAHVTGDRIAAEARARVRRATGETASGITVEEAHVGIGVVVFVDRPTNRACRAGWSSAPSSCGRIRSCSRRAAGGRRARSPAAAGATGRDRRRRVDVMAGSSPQMLIRIAADTAMLKKNLPRVARRSRRRRRQCRSSRRASTGRSSSSARITWSRRSTRSAARRS